MAVKDSEELKSDERYPLGDYSFRIERSSVPGSSNDKIEAICTDKDGKNARKSIQIPSSTQIGGWYVEANEDTADVYVTVGVPRYSLDGYVCDEDGYTGIVASLGSPGSGSAGRFSYVITPNTSVLSYAGTVFYSGGTSMDARYWPRSARYRIVSGGAYCIWEYPNAGSYKESYRMTPADQYIETVIGDNESKLVGRFAIDLNDAGGDGPGSDWTDPGDYDPDWEEGDPTHTLYVTVTGALSGRHNDPIVDPSYSYIPADKDTVKDYGCGGDGGHGGGGGAGASTVVIHKFATNQANSKEVTAIARRHGYGSGGGKGGKGGDGCILVYY